MRDDHALETIPTPHRLWPYFQIGYLYFQMRDCAEQSWLDQEAFSDRLDERGVVLPIGIDRYINQIGACLERIPSSSNVLLQTARESLKNHLHQASMDYKNAWRRSAHKLLAIRWRNAELDEPDAWHQYAVELLASSPMASEMNASDEVANNTIQADAAFQAGEGDTGHSAGSQGANLIPEAAVGSSQWTAWQLAERSLESFRSNLHHDAQSILNLGILLGTACWPPRAGRWSKQFDSTDQWTYQSSRQNAINELVQALDLQRIEACKLVPELSVIEWGPGFNADGTRSWWKLLEAICKTLLDPDSVNGHGYLGLTLRSNQNRVYRGEQYIKLQGPLRWKCLQLLYNAGATSVSREALFKLWPDDANLNSVDRLISDLRKALKPLEIDITRQRGVGKKLVDLRQAK